MRRFCAALALVAGMLLALPVGAGAQLRPLTTAVADGLFLSSNAGVRDTWLERAAGVNAGIVRLGISWAGVAPSAPPAGFDPANPADPAYRWEATDAAVRDAVARGLRPMITVNGAPAWAEGAGKPAGARPGTWKPSPTQLGSFAQALATRYSGHFADPLHPGQTLPRVGFFEVWNEPNQNYFLAPQYQGGELFMPGWYRSMLNHFYAGVQHSHSGAKVLAPATSPYGDPPGGERTPPTVFLRSMLCLRGGALKPAPCPDPAHFDILSHHPIDYGSPSTPALSPLDVSTPDMGRLERVLSKAERTGRALPRGQKPVWATELWWNSNPPNPNGVPLWRQARWIDEALYSLWAQGVSVVVNYPLGDLPLSPSGLQLQAGLYFIDGTPKPSATAFRFPLVTHRSGARIVAWGIAPGPGVVHLQKQVGARWRTIASVHTSGAPRPFQVRLPGSFGGHKLTFRAQQRSGASLPWVQY